MDYFKIKVESKDHSKEIQEWLFSLGYRWVSGCRKPSHLDARYLVFSKEIGEEDPTIGWTSDSRVFMDSTPTEKWFYGGELQDTPRETIKETLTGNTFRELTEAQLGGKTLQVDVFDVGWVDCTHTLDQVKVEDIDKPVKGYRIKPRICNGVELDECIKDPLEEGTEYFIANLLDNNYRNIMFWGGSDYDFKCLDKGIAYLNEESATKHAKAMLNLLD